MAWWTYPVQWFGKKETKIGPTKDGRLLRIFTRSLAKRVVVERVDVQCFRCGNWIEPNECRGANVKDGSGVTRNQHKACKVE